MRAFLGVVLIVLLAGCKHPLAVRGMGDIVELNEGVRSCSYEDSYERRASCVDNAVTVGAYAVSYRAEARTGWEFSHWDWDGGTACQFQEQPELCAYDIAAEVVALTEEKWPGIVLPATVAVFAELDRDDDGLVDSLDPAPGVL